jgi:4-hydroxybenzoate polyprenyltransferase
MLRTLRPLHWVKNGLVLAPVFFSGRAGGARVWPLIAVVFFMFCLTASAVYVFNDIIDAGSDRAHPRKRMRPYASGGLSRRDMLFLLVLTSLPALAGCAMAPAGASIMVLVYAAAMALYTLFFKRCWWAGALFISGGMLARVFAGAAAIDVSVSRWVLPCTVLLTCYVVLGKRLYDSDAAATRDTALCAAFYVCGTASLLCYSIYCLYDATMIKYGSRLVILSSIPVALALWRYAAVVSRPGRRREHLHAVVFDPLIAAGIALWFAVFAVIIYI